MSHVTEVLAEQLRAPGFRTADRGYDPASVHDHLAAELAALTQLERRVEETTARAVAAEAAAVRLEAEADTPPAGEDELLTVVFDGQRQADAVVAEAEADATRRRQEADERIAALRDDSEVRRLRVLVEERRAQLAATSAAAARTEDDLVAAAAATRACRETVGERLAAAAAGLRAMAASTTTSITTSTERT